MPRGRAEIKEWAKQGAGGRPETWRTLPQVKVIERVALLVAGARDFFGLGMGDAPSDRWEQDLVKKDKNRGSGNRTHLGRRLHSGASSSCCMSGIASPSLASSSSSSSS
jgi:hypothetical protein